MSNLKPFLSYLPCILRRKYFSIIFNIKKCALYSIKCGIFFSARKVNFFAQRKKCNFASGFTSNCILHLLLHRVGCSSSLSGDFGKLPSRPESWNYSVFHYFLNQNLEYPAASTLFDIKMFH
jgi:hypothetical protein